MGAGATRDLRKLGGHLREGLLRCLPERERLVHGARDGQAGLAVVGGTSQAPYPFQAVQGRMFRAPDEAVAGQGFLDLMQVRIGSWIDPTIDGVPVIVHIVGRTIEPGDNGDVLDFGMDALPAAGASAPMFYSLVLKPGVPAAAARTRLLAASGNRLDVQFVAR